MDEHIIIVINGRGGVGKDYCISHFTSKVGEGNVENISSIDPIKKIASQYGYDDNNKTYKSRKFLSDLKAVFTEWNDLPLIHTIKRVSKAINEENRKKFVFVHIREPKEIKKFVDVCPVVLSMMNGYKNYFRIVTLLIDESETNNRHIMFGNASDDNVNYFSYDFKYVNDRDKNIDEFYDFVMKNIVNPGDAEPVTTFDSNEGGVSKSNLT